jgi:hypothetical protein
MYSLTWARMLFHGITSYMVLDTMWNGSSLYAATVSASFYTSTKSRMGLYENT